MLFRCTAVAIAASVFVAGTAGADSIDPTSFTADLGVGDSVTISKTVTVSAGGPTDAKIDAFFLIDTSGSMGGVISAAKAAAGDIYTSITSSFGSDVAGGVGAFSENAGLAGSPCTFFDTKCPSGGVIKVPGSVLNQDVTTSQASVVSAINAITLSDPDYGGDTPESAYKAVELVAENASWRPGSSRFIFTFSDAPGKGALAADVISALEAEDITLVSLSFSGSSHATSMASVGALTYLSSASPASIVADITSGISAGFSTYDSVSVGDLGGGDPLIDVSVVCTGADTGTCVGAEALGDYDRESERTFTFDVTFTRLAAGLAQFNTYALVDGGIVATEADRFPGEGGPVPPPVPLPAGAWLLLTGVAGLGAMRKFRKS